jgi:mRNA interferase MazF
MATPENGLRLTSQVQLDKAMSINRSKIGPTFGRLDDQTMLSITRNLAAFLGMA